MVQQIIVGLTAKLYQKQVLIVQILAQIPLFSRLQMAVKTVQHAAQQ